jgi:hypothetical protein
MGLPFPEPCRLAHNAVGNLLVILSLDSEWGCAAYHPEL